mgnify:CR=1 FL=1
MSTHLYPEFSAHMMRVTETAHWLEWQDWAEPVLQRPELPQPDGALTSGDGHGDRARDLGQPGQVRRKNLGAAVGCQMFMLVFGPQAVTHPRLQAPGPAGPLGGAGAGDALGIEAGHATARVEARYAGEPGIDHHPHTVDGQAGLGDVGGEHHFARPGWGNGVDGDLLLRQGEIAVQRRKLNVRSDPRTQFVTHGQYFSLPRQKCQHAARVIPQHLEHRLSAG